jgi:hypothetical protein
MGTIFEGAVAPRSVARPRFFEAPGGAALAARVNSETSRTTTGRVVRHMVVFPFEVLLPAERQVRAEG